MVWMKRDRLTKLETKQQNNEHFMTCRFITYTISTRWTDILKFELRKAPPHHFKWVHP